MLMHFYRISPIDYSWEMMPSVKDTATNYIARCNKEEGFKHPGCALDSCAGLNDLLELVLKIAKHPHFNIGWEGDFTEGPKVFFLPVRYEETGLHAGFMWKQSNNGCTFVASPEELSYFDDLTDDHKLVMFKDARVFFREEEELNIKRIHEANAKWDKLTIKEQEGYYKLKTREEREVYVDNILAAREKNTLNTQGEA